MALACAYLHRQWLTFVAVVNAVNCAPSFTVQACTFRN